MAVKTASGAFSEGAGRIFLKENKFLSVDIVQNIIKIYGGNYVVSCGGRIWFYCIFSRFIMMSYRSPR